MTAGLELVYEQPRGWLEVNPPLFYPDIAPASVVEVAGRVSDSGFEFVRGSFYGEALLASNYWRELAASFRDLPVDRYLAKGADFRRRRYGRFFLDIEGKLADAPSAPFVQARRYNSYAGDVRRYFDELEPTVRQNPSLLLLIATDAAVVRAVFPTRRFWRVEVHQFRITARPGAMGFPTPEGIHRDGNDIFAIHLIDRDCRGGQSRVYSEDGRPLAKRFLKRPLDSLYVFDSVVLHDVSPIQTKGGCGVRDVINIDFFGL
ncbi:2OG-Fe dioxygenase family protein [Frankia sp. AgW1.1]|nr:2OG-Fe dioxygenase family protein [Frankia sp. AgW1.1]MBL7623431.1 2OG-Fe dioxygenase family protein [Frankia sp. AgB1.8]